VVAALAVYPPDLAASRLRIEQYRGALAEHGIELRAWSFFRSEDLKAWYGPSQLRRAAVLLQSLARLPTILRVVRGAGTILVQREALPVGPPFLEMLLASGRRLIWDVDDSVWVPYVSPTAGRVPAWLRAPRNKYASICRQADEVWAGSEVLQRWCRNHNHNVLVVPTIVDVPPELPSHEFTRTVGWVGSHSTKDFIESILPMLLDVQPPIRVLVVGAEPSVPTSLDCEVRPWSPENEAWALRESAVGLYPIDRTHPLADGKCGLKAVLFMAAGVPVVVTPTETNAKIVRDGVEGAHVGGPDDWAPSIERILADEATWQAMRVAAHDRALADYSLRAWAPVVVEHLSQLAPA
jgi:glycosyltransferase involved in cell wall biosynthesis